MAASEKTIHRAAERVVKALVEGKLLATGEASAQVEKRVTEAIRVNFREEAEIQREAERIFEENRRQTAGMDQRVLLLKIKEKLARERGFVL